jgi:toxin FitB
MIVLDTNVISELMRPDAEPRVARWVNQMPRAQLFTTAVCRAEIMTGIAQEPPGRRRDQLAEAADRVFRTDLPGRVLPFDAAAADEYAEIFPHRRRIGRPAKPLDTMIAAIARSHGAIVATRNVADFTDCGIELINPWQA